MTPEQFDAWRILEGLEGWSFCDRGGKATLKSLLGTDDRWCMRHIDYVVYNSVGKQPRLSPARHLNNDVPGSWKTVNFVDVPARMRDKLIAMAKGEKGKK